MSNSPKIRYEVRIIPRNNCAPDRSKYNKNFKPYEPVEAKNYFNTLLERYQCYNISKVTDNISQGVGENYIITLSTILDSEG